MKVLIIEDDPVSMKLASVILTEEGAKVAAVDSAEKALAVIAAERPEIILLDLALPKMGGLELARELKENPKTREIPIIAVTAYPDRFHRQEAVGAGCDSYIVKPLDTRTLASQVRAVVSKDRPGEKAG